MRLPLLSHVTDEPSALWLDADGSLWAVDVADDGTAYTYCFATLTSWFFSLLSEDELP